MLELGQEERDLKEADAVKSGTEGRVLRTTALGYTIQCPLSASLKDFSIVICFFSILKIFL